jgi:hypothetical protein
VPYPEYELYGEFVPYCEYELYGEYVPEYDEYG